MILVYEHEILPVASKRGSQISLLLLILYLPDLSQGISFRNEVAASDFHT